MFRTAAAAAALGLTAGLYLSTGTAMAEPENSTVTTEHPAADGNAAAGIHITDAKPEDNSLINQRNGNVITLEMVQRDIEWHRETARMLRGNN